MVVTPWKPELPPRTRRILAIGGGHAMEAGTTSAYAENTLKRGSLVFLQWNYLRVRGEYVTPIRARSGL